MRIEPVFLFDLDGTLVDSVYQHVLAWKEALDAEGIELSVWRIHRKIGMSGTSFFARPGSKLALNASKGFAMPMPPLIGSRLTTSGRCPELANY
jgi:phosphoglycolate phosphatase-like HAD superfamily hydrolase